MNKILVSNIATIFKLTSLTLASISALLFLFVGLEFLLIMALVLYAIAFLSFAVCEGFVLSEILKAKSQQKTAIDDQKENGAGIEATKAEEILTPEGEQTQPNEENQPSNEENKPTDEMGENKNGKGMVALSIAKLACYCVLAIFSIVILILY